jgi:hypothetical protein
LADVTDTQPAWRRSSYCGTSTCVEVVRLGDAILVRDSKNPEAGTLAFTEDEWRAFEAGVRNGEFRL